MTGYLIKGSREEYLMVIRSEGDEGLEAMRSLVNRLGQMRDKDIKELVKGLEFSLNRIDNE